MDRRSITFKINFFFSLVLTPGLIQSLGGFTLSQPLEHAAASGKYPKISLGLSQFSEARLELDHGSDDDIISYPSVRIALNDEESAEISQPLPLNKSVHGVVGERDLKMYASRLPHAGGGALKLSVQARGRPHPSVAAPLIVSVRTREGGYTFTLPQLNKGEIHIHSHSAGNEPVTHAPRTAHRMSVSRFMCPSEGEQEVCYVTIGVGASAGPDAEPVVYDFDLRLMELDTAFWYLNTSSAPRGALVSPAMPALFHYRWPPDSSAQAVRVAVASGDHPRCAADTRACVGDDCGDESGVDACAFLAVHNPICPLMLTPAEILASARHLSFTRCGTMIARRRHYPDGFFVSVILQSDDALCCPTLQCGMNDTMPRRKSVRVSVMDYNANFKAAAAPCLVAAMFIVIGLGSICMRPVLARAAVSTSWEPVAIAKAMSSRFLGHQDAKSFQMGLDLEDDVETESIVDARKNGDHTEVHTSKYFGGLETEPDALGYNLNERSNTDAIKYRKNWHSGTDSFNDDDGSQLQTAIIKSGGTLQSGVDATRHTDSLKSRSDDFDRRKSSQQEVDAVKFREGLKTGSGSSKDNSGMDVENKHLKSEFKRPVPRIMTESIIVNSMTENMNHSDSFRPEPSFVHFANSVQTGNSTMNRRDASDASKAADSKPLPVLASNLVVLNPVSLQVTCALLIAAFGISNVAIDVAAERRTGNVDRCYRNDLCCHDGQVMPDLNHLLSNVPYIGAGIGFLLAVYAQWHVYKVAMNRGRGHERGVPHDFNLFTAIGAALSIEGVTSGLYHVCPNNRNSHIDFFFIYYLCAAMGAKLFQTRRGVTARFHYTPALLVATITLLGSLQQVPGVTPQSWQMAVVLTHFSSSFLWAAQMYLTGHFGLFVPWCWEITSDLRTRRLAAAHIILNGGLALWGLLWPSAENVFHSSTYALLYFSLNTGIYVCYYMAMKLVVFRERPPWLSVFNILLGLATAVPALYFFVIRKPYNTNESPAMSRTVNNPCVLFDFYDSHDIWHFLSAAALFFLMLGVLTLDDDLLATPRENIPVF